MRRPCFFLFLLALILFSCKEKIILDNYFDKKASFNIKFYETDSVTKFTNLKQLNVLPSDEIYSKLVNWIDNNKTDWQISPASYIPDASIEQGSFRLLYLRKSNTVVANFIDSKNLAHQYSKALKNGELEFIYYKR